MRCKRKQASGRSATLPCNRESRRRAGLSRFLRTRGFETRKPCKQEPAFVATQRRTALPLYRILAGPLQRNLRQTNGVRDRSPRHNTPRLLPLPRRPLIEKPRRRQPIRSLPALSLHFFQFVNQLRLQILPGRFLDRAPLGRHGLLFCATLIRRALVDLARQM